MSPIWSFWLMYSVASAEWLSLWSPQPVRNKKPVEHAEKE